MLGWLQMAACLLRQAMQACTMWSWLLKLQDHLQTAAYRSCSCMHAEVADGSATSLAARAQLM